MKWNFIDIGFIEVIKSGAIITDCGNEILYNLRIP